MLTGQVPATPGDVESTPISMPANPPFDGRDAFWYAFRVQVLPPCGMSVTVHALGATTRHYGHACLLSTLPHGRVVTHACASVMCLHVTVPAAH